MSKRHLSGPLKVLPGPWKFPLLLALCIAKVLCNLYSSTLVLFNTVKILQILLAEAQERQ